jgi:hypothetical protein
MVLQVPQDLHEAQFLPASKSGRNCALLINIITNSWIWALASRIAGSSGCRPGDSKDRVTAVQAAASGPAPLSRPVEIAIGGLDQPGRTDFVAQVVAGQGIQQA